MTMPAYYLKIENPGVAPAEAFTLLGASTKRGSENSATIGKFGTGNKHGVAVLLRNDLPPVIFGGTLRMTFGTRPQGMNDGIREHSFNRVVVKYSGVDPYTKANRTATDDLGFVLEHGATDWLSVDLALREFVSNAIDRAIEEGEYRFLERWFVDRGYRLDPSGEIPNEWKYEAQTALEEYRLTAKDYENVVVEIVNENQVRAKAGHTRVFVPLNADVLTFFNNLGKWFLHFSEPHLLGQTILPKGRRNLGDRQTAVIYRRGVRVREFESSDTPSLFDYNLENLELDESRKVDDWRVQYEASKALALANKDVLVRLWQSFLDGSKYWEHSFSHYGLEAASWDDGAKTRWQEAFETVAGEDAVVATGSGGDMAARKGYKVVQAPEAFAKAAEKYGVKTPDKVLTHDEKEGRTILDSTPDAEAAVDFAWNLATKYNVTNGKSRPQVKTFRKIMDGGAQTLGYYKDGVVYINQDIAGSISLQTGWHGLTQQLLVTALEEVSHHVTGALDNSRDFQDYVLNLLVYLAKEQAGVA
jgi:hypothetical protein